MRKTVRTRLAGRARLRRRRRLVLSVVVFVALLGALFYLSSGRYRISEITVAGLERTPEAEVRQYVNEWLSGRWLSFYPNNVIWFIRKEALSVALENRFPTIKDIVIQRDFPQKIKLAFEEFAPWGVLCKGSPEECFWIDMAGVAFEKAPDFTGIVVPKIRDERAGAVVLGGTYLSSEFMHLVTFFNEKAAADSYLQSVQFTIDAEDETLRILTRSGWEIFLFERTDPQNAYSNLVTALKKINDIQGLEYIDLRFGNKIFYRFK